MLRQSRQGGRAHQQSKIDHGDDLSAIAKEPRGKDGACGIERSSTFGTSSTTRTHINGVSIRTGCEGQENMNRLRPDSGTSGGVWQRATSKLDRAQDEIEIFILEPADCFTEAFCCLVELTEGKRRLVGRLAQTRLPSRI